MRVMFLGFLLFVGCANPFDDKGSAAPECDESDENQACPPTVTPPEGSGLDASVDDTTEDAGAALDGGNAGHVGDGEDAGNDGIATDAGKPTEAEDAGNAGDVSDAGDVEEAQDAGEVEEAPDSGDPEDGTTDAGPEDVSEDAGVDNSPVTCEDDQDAPTAVAWLCIEGMT